MSASLHPSPVSRFPPGVAVRRTAAAVLLAVRDGNSLKSALPGALGGLADPRDRALCESLCFHSLRHLRRYDDILSALLDKPLPPAAREVHALLLIGLAQLDALGLVEHAAVAATVEAVRVKHPRLAGLSNAILRRYLRERAVLATRCVDLPAVRFSHPDWLYHQLQRDWPDDVLGVLAANTTEAPVWIRVNRSRVDDPERLRAAWRTQGVESEAASHQPLALRLVGSGLPTLLAGWAQGHFAVQDVSVQNAVRAMDLQPGLRVLDACAAPGGKTVQIHDLCPQADLLALDVDARRVRRMQDAFARQGVTAELRAVDAAQVAQWWDGQRFERILIDAPCSGTGVIRRQPDILLHRRESDLPALHQRQRSLLEALWPLLSVGGRLVYATCSVLKSENADTVGAFLADHTDAESILLDASFGRPSGAGWQRLPGEAGGDGFFVAALRKTH
ncbi:MAG: Ribosomal RNA small subunit methyltransferase B [Alphaproteobacteria bacterium ADurb.BinA280]|nr:16S rRNA (cytosine(967)-C(5))-methyltransferase RsmB [Aquimonas sp.]OPZ13403.1 MAG: Ribosomal RNA small subunit methyltransferase B [Alphaproteobacteria bacterium ADurb.BinA280]